MIFTLVVEFGRQRRKFDLIHPIDIGLLENQIKSTFAIEEKHFNDYLIQIYDEQVKDYLDLTSDSFLSRDTNLIKGQIISTQNNSSDFPTKVFKEQIVGLITLESLQNSLQKWSQLLQNIQSEIAKELENVRETIVAVKCHYKLIDGSHDETLSPVDRQSSDCSSPSSVSQCGRNHFNPSHTSRGKTAFQRKDFSGRSAEQAKTNGWRRGTFDSNANREKHSYYPPSQAPAKPIEYTLPVTVTYQRFDQGVQFQGELAKYYNPSYFFLRISNQTESFDEMHRDMNLHYNKVASKNNYFPQSGEFCVAKSGNDSNWYRARILRLIGNDKAQLIFIDNGQIGEMNLNLIEPLQRQFSEHPAQALACSLAQVLPFTQNGKCGWNRRACISLENTLKNDLSISGKVSLKVTIDEHEQIKWPMMFVQIATEHIPNVSHYMCDLYLSRRSTNNEMSLFWSSKVRPEQYVFFNLSSLINQKQYFLFNNDSQSSTLTFDQSIDLIINDPEFTLVNST